MEPVTRHSVSWGVGLCCLLSWGSVFFMGMPVGAELYSVTDLGTLGGQEVLRPGSMMRGRLSGILPPPATRQSRPFCIATGR